MIVYILGKHLYYGYHYTKDKNVTKGFLSSSGDDGGAVCKRDQSDDTLI